MKFSISSKTFKHFTDFSIHHEICLKCQSFEYYYGQYLWGFVKNSKIDYKTKLGKYLLKLTGQKLISTSVGSTVPFSVRRRRSVHVTHESQVQRYREGGAAQADSNSPMLSTTLCHNLRFSLLDNAPNQVAGCIIRKRKSIIKSKFLLYLTFHRSKFLIQEKSLSLSVLYYYLPEYFSKAQPNIFDNLAKE